MVRVRDTRRKMRYAYCLHFNMLVFRLSIFSDCKSKKWKRVSVPCRKFGVYRQLWSSRMKEHSHHKGRTYILFKFYFISVFRQSHSVTGIGYRFSVYPRMASRSLSTCLGFPSTEILGIADVCHRNWLPPPPNCFKNLVKAGEMTQFMKQTWEPGSEFLVPV